MTKIKNIILGVAILALVTLTAAFAINNGNGSGKTCPNAGSCSHLAKADCPHADVSMDSSLASTDTCCCKDACECCDDCKDGTCTCEECECCDCCQKEPVAATCCCKDDCKCCDGCKNGTCTCEECECCCCCKK